MSPGRHHLDQPVDQPVDRLGRVAEDDALLEALARRDDVPEAAGHSDELTTLLRALTMDVDTHAERAVSRPAGVPSVSLLPASERRRRPMRVRRSTAALGLLGAIVAGSTGVAAAVTGDPFAGLGGLQRVIQAATSGGAEAPARPHGPASEPPGAPGAVPTGPGGASAGPQAGTLTFAPAPTGPAGTAGRKPEAPGAVLPTASPRRPEPSSSASATQSRDTGSSTGHKQSQTHQPAPATASHPSRPPEPTGSANPPEQGERSGADLAPALDAGRPGVSSSSPRKPVPAPGEPKTPQPPTDGD